MYLDRPGLFCWLDAFWLALVAVVWLDKTGVKPILTVELFKCLSSVI